MRRVGLSVLGLGLSATSGFAALSHPSMNAPSPEHRAGAAIVTGGSRGIGAACSKALAAQGYDVVVVYRSCAEEASNVVSEISAQGGRAVAIQADVSDEAQVVSLFEQVDQWRSTTPLRALVNNAGLLGPRAGLSQVTASSLMDLLKVNTIGPALCIREAEKRMSATAGHSGGSIVQISSGSAYIGTPLQYSCSKGGLNSLTIGLVAPLARQSIRINTISPGMTDTDMVAETLPHFDLSVIPLGRAGTPEEIASCVVWLCSEDASYVAGANIRVAGGRPPGTTLG